MSNGFKAEWDKHQRDFLALMLNELTLLDVDLKIKIVGLIEEYKPGKGATLERIKSFFGMAKPDSADLVKNAFIQYFQGLHDELFGKEGRRTYQIQRDEYVSECLAKISGGKSISPFVEDLVAATFDTRKSKRFMGYFALLTFGTPKERVVEELCEFDPKSNALKSFEYERIAGIWKRELKVHKPIDAFHGFNETLGFAALDKLFADAGGLTTTVTAGTPCSHAGVLPKILVLDDGIPCWTTTDPNKAINYAGIAVTQHVTEPSAGSFPQIINGVVDVDLHCGVMHGPSFDAFTRVFCGTSHAHLKAWIASWCAEPGRNFDGLVGTNGGADELVIMKPFSQVTWTPWITLPTTQAGFDRKYGKPPTFAYKAPQLASLQSPPPSSPTP